MRVLLSMRDQSGGSLETDDQSVRSSGSGVNGPERLPGPDLIISLSSQVVHLRSHGDETLPGRLPLVISVIGSPDYNYESSRSWTAT